MATPLDHKATKGIFLMLSLLKIKVLRAVALLLLGAFAHLLPASAQVTSLSMTSDSGDYIGQGQTYLYTPTDGTFSASAGINNNNVSFFFNTPTFDHFWSLDFAAPNGAPLTPGTYLNATRYPFQVTSVPGLSVSGDGRGCNMLSGSFQVLQAVYGPANTLVAFEATFEQHCEGFAPALRGQIRYNANVALYLTAPTHIQAVQNQKVSFLVTGTDAQGRRVFLNATNLPPGATFTDLGNSTGSFSWTPSSSQSGTFLATFLGDNRQGNQATMTTQINVIPPPPTNDDFARPILIPSSSVRYTVNATNATTSPDDPWCFGNAQSVWFAFTPPTNMRLEANTFGSGYDTSLSVYTGARGALNQIGCNDDANNSLQSRIRFDAIAGTTYYLMASSRFFPVPTANLILNMLPGPPPFSFNPSVAQFGSVTPSTGALTLSGTLQCTQPAYVTISGQVKQKRGGATVTGYWSAFVPCDGVTAWTAPVQSQTVLFRGRSALLFAGGKAEVGATATAFDPDTGEFKQMNLATVITLRGK
jgi:hypothetical protein